MCVYTNSLLFLSQQTDPPTLTNQISNITLNPPLTPANSPEPNPADTVLNSSASTSSFTSRVSKYSKVGLILFYKK